MVEQRVDACVGFRLGTLEASVHESEVLVSLLDRGSGHGLEFLLEIVGLVRWSIQVSVLSGEWIEGGKLHPSAANFLLLVLIEAGLVFGALEEATNIGSDVRNTKHVEIHHASNRVTHVVERSVVVSSPMTGPLTSARVRRSGQQELSLVLKVIQSGILGFSENLIGNHGLHVAEQRVGIELAVTGRWVSSIQSNSHIVEIPFVRRNEGKQPSALLRLVLRIASVPSRVVLN